MAFILKSQKEGHQVVNYDLEPIEYFHNGKSRLYHPDFLVDGKLIVEIKWLGFIYEQKKEEIHLKKEALDKWCQENNYNNAFITNEDIQKSWIKKARKLHERLKYGRKKVSNKKRRSRKIIKAL